MKVEDRQAIEGRALLLFDGLCGMCNSTVRFLIRRDPASRLLYTPLESPLGQQILFEQTNLAPQQNQGSQPWIPDGIVLVEAALTPRQTVSVRSDAVARVLLLLQGGWPWLGKLLSWVPRGLREWTYGFVARHRYRFYGIYATCPIPSPNERALILGTLLD